MRGTILLGEGKASIDNCSIHFISEVLRIETFSLLSDRTAGDVLRNVFKSKYAKLAL